MLRFRQQNPDILDQEGLYLRLFLKAFVKFLWRKPFLLQNHWDSTEYLFREDWLPVES